jgi:hypothetical protein
MFRRITYNSADAYCRYLDIGLQTDNSANICGGRFGSFLKDRLGIVKLPYGLKLAYLICDGAFIPELLVKLPDGYFFNWTNFPEKPARFDREPSEQEKAAGSCDLHILNTGKLSLNDLLHPYDKSPLKQKFCNKFSIGVPKFFDYKSLPSKRRFLPYEAYAAYWRGYLLVEALDEYTYIDKFLSREVGIKTFSCRVSQIAHEWKNRYQKTFERLSFYRTAQAVLHTSHSPSNLTYRDISSFIIGKNKSELDVLEQDLEILLILFQNWQIKKEHEGK